jgi:hypothetical protein
MEMALHYIPHQKGEYHGLSKPWAQKCRFSGKGGWPPRSTLINRLNKDVMIFYEGEIHFNQ